MHILFVLPSHVKTKNLFMVELTNKFFIFERSYIPLALTALITDKHTVEVIEGGHKHVNFNKSYDLVCITSLTPTAPLAYSIADEFRKRGVKVVLGGWHASALPEEAKQHADAVVIGEAEDTFPQLLKDIENNTLKKFYMPTKPVDMKNIPHPRLDICPKTYRVGVQATRGCPYGCEYCSITNQKYRNIYREKPVERVIEEIKDLPTKIFYFHDNSFTIDVKYSKDLFKQMKNLNKKFIAYGNAGVLGRDEELLNLASDAGCIAWRIGFESITQESLNDIGKSANKVKDYYTIINKIHDHGAVVESFFMLGFDYDTLDTFDATYEFVRKSEADFPVFLILTPYPGTPLFDRFDKQGRILTKDWSKYDSLHHVIFQPKNMTPSELLSNTVRIRFKTYSIPNSIRRIFRSGKLSYYSFLHSITKNVFYASTKSTPDIKMVKYNLNH